LLAVGVDLELVYALEVFLESRLRAGGIADYNFQASQLVEIKGSMVTEVDSI
jgi:hypothetical protein